MTHPHYNRDNFPNFVVNHGNWDICADENGKYCAAIPAANASDGCKASHFGDIEYVRCTLGDILPEHWKGPLVRHNFKA